MKSFCFSTSLFLLFALTTSAYSNNYENQVNCSDASGVTRSVLKSTTPSYSNQELIVTEQFDGGTNVESRLSLGSENPDAYVRLLKEVIISNKGERNCSDPRNGFRYWHKAFFKHVELIRLDRAFSSETIGYDPKNPNKIRTIFICEEKGRRIIPCRH